MPPELEPIAQVPLWLYVTTCTVLALVIAAALISDWKAAGKNHNDHV